MRASLLVLLLMVAFAITSTVTSLSNTVVRYVHRTAYTVGVPDTGLQSVRCLIPKGEALGFVTDEDDSEAASRRLYGLTYSLAPLIVENTATHRFVIGDFRKPSSISPALTRYRLRVVQDLGNGFQLLAPQ